MPHVTLTAMYSTGVTAMYSTGIQDIVAARCQSCTSCSRSLQVHVHVLSSSLGTWVAINTLSLVCVLADSPDHQGRTIRQG